jgi:signal transduction histidine kinase
MVERLRSVRVRITLVATVVTGVAVVLAGLWLVHAVESSLTSSVQTTAEERLDTLRDAIQEGRLPSPEELAALGRDGYLQVTDDGNVIAASRGGDAPLVIGSSQRGVPPAGQADPSARYGLPPGAVRVVTTKVDAPTGHEYDLLAAASLAPVRDGVDAVQNGLWVALPLLVGAVALLAWVLAGRALRPVESIRTQVEAISATTLDRRVPVPASGDEVARLAHTMNAMLDRLEDASSRQQRFVADASHELRSPVAAIRTELEVAQRTATAGEWPAVAERLLAEEARLEAVIADLLLLASLDEGAAGSEHVTIDLGELASEEARRASGESGIHVEVEAPAGALIHGSRTQLRRAVANLLDNAGRHARSSIRLAVHQRDGRVRLLVDDDGPGIPEADRLRVFERFTRLDEHRARSTRGGGAGLGLSLVQRIVDGHGGSASIDTAPLGGARVVLDLPAHAAGG